MKHLVQLGGQYLSLALPRVADVTIASPGRKPRMPCDMERHETSSTHCRYGHMHETFAVRHLPNI